MAEIWQWESASGKTHLLKPGFTWDHVNSKFKRGPYMDTICGTWFEIQDPDDYPLAPGLVDEWCQKCRHTDEWETLYLTPVESTLSV